MSNTSSIFALFSVLVSVMLFGIWSNIHAYAQQSSSPTLSTSSPPTGSSPSKSISAQLKAKMCDPSNPSLKVVNTTEARVCGIPKTIKNTTTTAATPITSAVSSPSPTTQQTVTTKPTTAATSLAAHHPKQQQITATNNNNTAAISRLTEGATGAKITPVKHPTNTSLQSTSPLGIAPQIKSVNQQPPQPITGINNTAGQNYTFTTSSLAATSDQLLYLGYHGATNPTHGNSNSKGKDSPDDKPHIHSSTRSVSDSASEGKSKSDSKLPHIKKIITTDNDSTVKKRTSSTKVDRTSSTNAESSKEDKNSLDTESSSDHAVNSDSSWKKRTKSDRTDSTIDNGSSKKDKANPDTKPHTPDIITNIDDDGSDVISSSHNDGSSSKSSSSSSIIENDIPSVIMKSFNFK